MEKNIKNLVLFFLGFWFIFILIIYFISKNIYSVFGALIACIISIFIIIKKMNEEWSGKITKIITKTYKSEDEITRTERIAYIKLTNNKTKKMKIPYDWNEGDFIVKKKGEYSPKKINKEKSEQNKKY